ncbi:MAG: ribosome-associated translation inhibitor RaiA [Ruminococcaceae bacterium]|nr:ribosome-associated translation inhibitor RaiA [Oscillospiraceae bacterium]
MKTNIYLRKVELGNEKKEMLIKKIDKLGKFFNSDATADIVVGTQKDKMIVELTIRTTDMIYRAEERNEEVYNATDDIVEAITRQIRKNKTRLAKKLRDGVSKEIDFISEMPEDDAEIKIVKTKTHHVKPMSAEEAVLQMNLLGHSFFVFRNAQTNTTDIVYRRKDGDYGLIETD